MTTTTDRSRRVLQLLAQGKITVDDADALLRALQRDDAAPADDAAGPGASGDASPKWIRFTIEKQRDGQPPKTFTIRTPIAAARSGLKLGAMFKRFASQPFAERLRQEGIDVDFSKLDVSQLDTLFAEMNEMEMDVDGGRTKIRLRCE